MTWGINAPYKAEVKKCRFRLLPYCHGVGLDIGCGPEKIRKEAIGVDMGGVADINCNIERGIDIFSEGFFDYIFSSHCLEDMEDHVRILREWWSKLKVGGFLVLYLPHRDYYPNMGQEGANPNHKHDFIPDDIIKAMDFATYQLVHNETHSEGDEYSFDLVFRKLADFKIDNRFVKMYNSPAVNFDWREL